MRKSAVLLAGAAALVVAAVAGAGARAEAKVRLQPFRSCGELVRYAKAHAAGLAGSGGIASQPGVVAAPARSAGVPAGATDYSSTNVQEAGVDEPDLVKTDGSSLFAVAGDRLYAVDTRGARPRLRGSLALPPGAGHELLLYRHRLLVLSSAGAVEGLPVAGPGIVPPLATKTILSEVDVRDPRAPKLVRALTVDGAYLAARLVGATARVVIGSTPRFPPVAGRPGPGAVASSTLGNWLPDGVLENARTGRASTRSLVQCRSVLHPPAFSGLGLVTVLTIDLGRGLPPVDADAVMMGSGTVYASPTGLYVASQRWLPVPAAGRAVPPSGTTTEIHRFDTSRPDRTDYGASGTVPGFLLDRWSLSEYRGHLRVATTTLPLWWGVPGTEESETFVSVLGARAGRLVTLGRAGGIGRGERVYAVRFVGDAGFVVTFRRVDPMATLDLHDPARPNVLGVLRMRGYSAYLHPLGRDRLLGIGQDATGEGRVLGTQVSLFDVSSLRAPRRLDAVLLGPGSSEVEYDPRAFLYWPPRALAVLPVQVATPSGEPFAGALAFRVGRDRIERLRRIAHPAGAGRLGPPVRRSLVVGDRLYTVSDRGVEATDLRTLAEAGWLPFG